MAKFPSGSGPTPKGSGTPQKKSVHPSNGKAASPQSKTTGVEHTSFAGGKPHPGIGKGKDQKYDNPKVKTYAQGPGKFSGGF